MSRSSAKPGARAPQRERGRRRVAALLEAAVTLFAEKGYDAATMTEVAGRAGAPIGSLYQFFPSKEALVDACLDRFSRQAEEALNEIEARASTLTLPELVAALLGLMDRFHPELAAAATVIESRQETSTRAAELRLSMRRHIARILRIRIPTLSPGRAQTMAVVVVQLMKVAGAQRGEEDLAVRKAVLKEIKYLICLYLNDRAGPLV
jgi:AcrR family transcriptional regulator